jgi:hypothetical protein
VPQALNRYAAAPIGQPGVFQAAKSNPFATAFGHQIPGTAVGVAIAESPASRVIGKQLWGRIEFNQLPTEGLAGTISRFTTSRIGQSLTRLPFGLGEKIAARYAGRYHTQLITTRLDQGGALVDELLAGGGAVSSRYYNARILSRWEVPIIEQGTYGRFNPWWKVGLKAGGAAFFISGAFQLYDDWDTPYLTGGQKAFRAGFSGFVGLSSAFAGAGVGALAGTATGVPIAGTVAGAVVGFGIGLWAELQLTPRIFERTGNIPERHLAPFRYHN